MSEFDENPKALADEILAGGSIEASDVLRLRQSVFKDGVVNRKEADFLFDLDFRSRKNHPDWNVFFVEALTDYFVTQQHPPGVLSADDGAFLISRVTHDGKIDHESEFELLVSIASKAQQCPHDVVDLILRAVKETVLSGGGVLFGPNRRRRGVIDDADVAVIEKVLYGTGSGGGFTINKAEAELLFDLNDATAEKENAAGWKDLFARAVGNYLMYPRGAQEVQTGGEYDRQQAWLQSRERTMLQDGMAAIAAKGLFGAADDTGEAEAAAREQAAAAEAAQREAVDQDEVSWLIRRIGKDGVLHDNEKALLAFVKEKAGGIDPSLKAYFEEIGM